MRSQQLLRTITGLVATTFCNNQKNRPSACGKIDTENTYAAAVQVVSATKTVDLTDYYFHASGAGKVRIRNVIGVAASLILLDQLHGGAAALEVKHLVVRHTNS